MSNKPSRKEDNDIARKTEVQAVFHSGPLPPPEVLHGYNVVVPGSAERILVLVEQQQAHRHSLETSAMRIESRNSLLGIIAAFSLSTITVLCGAFVAYHGMAWPGVILGTTGLASVVGTFIYGTQQRRQERETKLKVLQGK